jgi:hypothetical protein
MSRLMDYLGEQELQNQQALQRERRVHEWYNQQLAKYFDSPDRVTASMRYVPLDVILLCPVV